MPVLNPNEASFTGLGSSPFARRYLENRGCFLFLGVLRCFSSPGYRSPVLYIQTGATRHNSGEVSPFGHLRIKVYVATPRSFSQLVASFIGILRQGIHCARLSNFLRLTPLFFGEKTSGTSAID